MTQRSPQPNSSTEFKFGDYVWVHSCHDHRENEEVLGRVTGLEGIDGLVHTIDVYMAASKRVLAFPLSGCKCTVRQVADGDESQVAAWKLLNEV